MVREVIETIRPDQPFDAMRSVRVIVSPDLMDSENINVQDKNITIEENGLTVVTPDTGYQGLGEVQITTNVPVPNLQLYKSVTVNSNKLTVIEPDQGYTGMRQVQVTTNIPSGVNNQNKNVNIDTNGFQQIVPDQGYSGIGELNLTVDIPTPVIQDDSIRYIEASNEARQVIVRPDQGFDALEKVTLNIASATLARNQNILTLTSNGTFNLPSVANSNVLGFADSCTVTVNVELINIRYISLSSAATASGKVDLLNVVFSGPGLTTYSIPPGRTVLLVTVNNNNKVIGFTCIGNRTGASDNLVTNFTNNVLVTEINYDIGDRVYLKNENEDVIMSLGVHEAGTYNYRTDYSAFNPEIMNFMYNN